MAPYTFKSLDEATWEMLALYWGLSGLAPDTEEGSVLRTIFEAVGFQVEDLSFRFDQGLQRAIPAAVFEAFGFTPEPAARAQVSLRFTRPAALPAPLPIPKGFRVARFDAVEYETLADAEIPAGSTEVTVAARAVEAGAIGNCPGGAIVVPRGALPGLQSVSNPTPATGGSDGEPLEEQKRRFARYIASVHRATPAALAATALATRGPSGERATEVLVLDAVNKPTLLPGYVEVWVDDGAGTAGVALVAAIQAALQEVRAAGTFVRVYAAPALRVDVTFSLAGTAAALEAAQEAARAYFRRLRIGQKVSRENLIAALTVAHPEVVEVTLPTPADDVIVPQTSRAVLGTLTATLGS